MELGTYNPGLAARGRSRGYLGGGLIGLQSINSGMLGEEHQPSAASRVQAYYSNPLALAIGGLFLWAGYKRGQKVQQEHPEKGVGSAIVGSMAWSLLGPIGPGYLVGRLTS